MILIITHKTDFTADFIVNKLNEKKISYKRFNCEDILTYNTTISYNNQFKYSILEENDFKSVWFRRTKFPDLGEIPIHQKSYLIGEIDSFAKNLFSILDANWLSEPFAVYRAENKLLQLKVAQNLGFTVPATLVTNSKEELILFYQKHNENIIVKPISQTRISNNDNASFIFTNKIEPELIKKIEEYDLTPCIFQENIEKDYEVRVTVIGRQVFSAAVYSQQDQETVTDWRRKKLFFKKVDLPAEIQILCVDMVRGLNLQFGAIDLIKTKSGDYIFLEINPNGQWVWIENETGLPISDAIIKFLTCEAQ